MSRVTRCEYVVRVGVMVVAGMACFANPASGQLRGRVTAHGEGVPNVAVELWNSTTMLAARRSDDEGRFSFDSSATAGVTGLVARRIGFRPVSLPRQDWRDDVRLEMEEVFVPLATLVTTAEREACPNRETAEARDVWNAVRRRYFPLPYRYGMAYYATIDSSVLRASDRERSGDPRPFEYIRSIGAAQRLADSARIADVGYAYEYKVTAARPTRFHKLDRRWKYPKLQSYMAQHFLDQTFGDRHTFSLGKTDGSELVVSFCPRSRDAANISGSLVIRSDMTLVSARWRYHTPDPDDDAGGEVLFVPPARWSTRPVLLPAESTTWQRSPGEFRDYYRQEVAHYRRWNAQDTMLPVRLGVAPRDSMR